MAGCSITVVVARVTIVSVHQTEQLECSSLDVTLSADGLLNPTIYPQP